ncbi:MAG: hypothetical protein WB660_10865, partial [Candidatus Sulfotelmatobacter sp.]
GGVLGGTQFASAGSALAFGQMQFSVLGSQFSALSSQLSVDRQEIIVWKKRKAQAGWPAPVSALYNRLYHNQRGKWDMISDLFGEQKQ